MLTMLAGEFVGDVYIRTVPGNHFKHTTCQKQKLTLAKPNPEYTIHLLLIFVIVGAFFTLPHFKVCIRVLGPDQGLVRNS